jgi:hypothetical protein
VVLAKVSRGTRDGDDYRAHLRRRLIESNVPENLHEGLIAYMTERRPVGSFLTAVLSNDLQQAVTRADPITGRRLRETVLFLHNYAPAPSWGSPAAVTAWLVDTAAVPEIFE